MTRTRTITAREAALHIKSMGGGLTIEFSEYTDCWYASARIEESDGSILKGGSEHRDDPEEAVLALFDYYRAVAAPSRLIVWAHSSGRKAWRWNGVCFVQVDES